MTTKKTLLLIPVENQVRELDPKLLLACIAARRGFSSVVGSRREMEFCIDSFPRSIYLSKSMTIRSLLFFQVARRFGHEIVTWDEEALVHLPAETYFSRRLHPRAIRHVSQLFAWGPDNVELWKQYPHLPPDLPIHSVGNPRTDMLRPEMHAFYENEVRALRDQYGKFILINTNFNHVNAFGPDMNLFRPVKRPGETARFGRAARGMSREYAERLWHHKHAVFKDFQQMIPKLARAFDDVNIVIRPHPTERHDVYRRIAADYPRVHVTNEGNVVPWLMATAVVLHNGCTTGLEAFVLGVPAISYRATINEKIDSGFYRLPNAVSHQCFDFEQLRAMLQKILSGRIGAADGKDRRLMLEHYMSGLQGPLACERMVEVLEQMAQAAAGSNGLSFFKPVQRGLLGAGLRLVRGIKSSLPGSHNKPEFQRHRYPGIALAEVQDKVLRFQRLLGDKRPLEIAQLSDVMFRIN